MSYLWEIKGWSACNSVMTKQLAFTVTSSLNYTSYLCSIYHFWSFFHYFDYITTLQLTPWNIKRPPLQPVYHYFSDIYILYLSEKLNGNLSLDGRPLPQVQPGLLHTGINICIRWWPQEGNDDHNRGNIIVVDIHNFDTLNAYRNASNECPRGTLLKVSLW